jgi:hypothetical protein
VSAGEIVVNRLRHPCDVPVVSSAISGLSFPNLPMRESASLIVLSVSGTDDNGPAHHKRLRARLDKQTGKPLGLSCAFHIDHRGIAHQFADALSRTTGAGNIGNKRGVLLTLSNRFDPVRTNHGVKRNTVIEELNGESSLRTMLTAPQMKSALALVDALCDALSIPCVVPMRGAHVLTKALPPAELEAFRGVVGMFHLDARRADPGAYVLRALAAKDLRRRAEQDG